MASTACWRFLRRSSGIVSNWTAFLCHSLRTLHRKSVRHRLYTNSCGQIREPVGLVARRQRIITSANNGDTRKPVNEWHSQPWETIQREKTSNYRKGKRFAETKERVYNLASFINRTNNSVDNKCLFNCYNFFAFWQSFLFRTNFNTCSNSTTLVAINRLPSACHHC